MDNEVATLAMLQQLVEQVRAECTQGKHVGPETRFVEDLGLASLELIGLVYLCEQTFAVDLVGQPGLLAQLRTFGESLGAINRLRKEQARGCDIPLAAGLA